MARIDTNQFGRKFIIVSIALAVLTTGVGMMVYQSFSRAEVRRATEKLQLYMDLRRGALEQRLATTRSEIRLWSSQARIANALEDFSDAWYSLSDDPMAELQLLYISNNPYPLGKKDELDAADDDSQYTKLHRKIHPWMRRFLEKQGYYDVFLIDLDGNIVYTVFKELDFATNLENGEWRDSGLARAFRAARDAGNPDAVVFEDFSPYGPSHGEPAGFVASQVYDASLRLRGVLAFQASIEHINEIMQFDEGMGETGETYVVGPDFLMRSNSRFFKESTILKTEVRTEPAERAFIGDTGVMLAKDYRGVNVYSAYGSLEFQGVKWATLAEKDEAEVLSPLGRIRLMVFCGVVLVWLTLMIFATLLFSSVNSNETGPHPPKI